MVWLLEVAGEVPENRGRYEFWVHGRGVRDVVGKHHLVVDVGVVLGVEGNADAGGLPAVAVHVRRGGGGVRRRGVPPDG